MAVVGPRVCDPTSEESRRALVANIIPYSEDVERPAKPLVEMVREVKRYGTWVNDIDDPKTWERFCLNVLGRPAGWFDDLEHGVALLSGGSIQQVQDISEQCRQAKKQADPDSGEYVSRGRPKKDLAENHTNSMNKQGMTTPYTLRRLARDGHEELLDAIAAGEMSVNAAAIQVGYRKKKTPEELTVANFRKSESRLVPLRIIVDELEPHEAVVVRDWINELLESAK